MFSVLGAGMNISGKKKLVAKGRVGETVSLEFPPILRRPVLTFVRVSFTLLTSTVSHRHLQEAE
jgi:hypothetical protein